MTNTITFRSAYKSISSLPEIRLPKLVVLTGKNGSGKTHMLEALKGGNLGSSVVSDLSDDVVLYDWNSILPTDTGVFNVHEHMILRSNWFEQVKNQRKELFNELQASLSSGGIPSELCSSLAKIRQLRRLEPSQLNALENDEKMGFDKRIGLELVEFVNQEISRFASLVCERSIRNNRNKDIKQLASLIVAQAPDLILESSESKFFDDKRLLWGEVDPFRQAFGRLFSVYRTLMHRNDRLQKYAPVGSGLAHLEKDQFVKEHGEPPWDFVNRILEVCALDFRVDAPPLHEDFSFEPTLHKISSRIEMGFDDLSSGEKVLMSFALCLYNASDTRQMKKFPKLLLLDEVDAPLHPSMVVSLLKTIQDVLVDEKKISVLLTTHCSSTVALAPEESIYEMNPEGPKVVKCSKGRAISILTAGVPTLSINFEGRRQVFVESKADAGVYESIYQRYKHRLESERSLSFIEVGNKPQSGGEANAGCAQVRRIVNGLSQSGNESVFGLVDWDGSVQETNRIKVLSPGIRNGIESAVLDPVIISAVCVRENIGFCRDNGLIESSEAYSELGEWTEDRWQTAVCLLEQRVLAELSDTEAMSISESVTERESVAGICDANCALDSSPVANDEPSSIEVHYLNGMTLNLQRGYLHMDDHILESAVVRAFPFLRTKHRRAGDLMVFCVENVLGDFPELIPRDILETLGRLLTDLVHKE